MEKRKVWLTAHHNLGISQAVSLSFNIATLQSLNNEHQAFILVYIYTHGIKDTSCRQCIYTRTLELPPTLFSLSKLQRSRAVDRLHKKKT